MVMSSLEYKSRELTLERSTDITQISPLDTFSESSFSWSKRTFERLHFSDENMRRKVKEAEGLLKVKVLRSGQF